MKRISLLTFLLFIISGISQIAKAQIPEEYFKSADSIGDGYYRMQYTNVLGCTCEIQSFDSAFTTEDINNILSILVKIGGKERGLNIEFPSYSMLKSIDDKKMLINYGKEKVKAFEHSLKKLEKYEIVPEAKELKDSIIKHYTEKLKFEKAMLVWLQKGDDKQFRQTMMSMTNDLYMKWTLDKLLVIENWKEKFNYTYNEVGALLDSKLYPYENLIKTQNKILYNHKVKFVLNKSCNG